MQNNGDKFKVTGHLFSKHYFILITVTCYYFLFQIDGSFKVLMT